MKKSELRKYIEESVLNTFNAKVQDKVVNLMDVMYKEQVDSGIQDGSSGYDIYGNILDLKR